MRETLVTPPVTFTLDARQLHLVMHGSIDQARVLLAIAAGANTFISITRVCDVPHPAIPPTLHALQRASLIFWDYQKGWALQEA